jgi:hypothetical protein
VILKRRGRMINRFKFILWGKIFSVLLLAFSLSPNDLLSQDKIKRSVVDMMGGTKSKSPYVLYDAVGQNIPLVESTSGIYTLRSGFLAGINLQSIKLGDLSRNGVLDVPDIVLMLDLILGVDDYNWIGDMDSIYGINVLDLVLLLIGICREGFTYQAPRDLFNLVELNLNASWIEDGKVGLSAGLSNGFSVAGMELWFRYDRSKYNIDDINLLSNSGGLDIAYREDQGRVKVLVYGLNSLGGTGSKPVCRIDLKPIDRFLSDNSGITIENIILSDLNGISLDYNLTGTGEEGVITLIHPRVYTLHQNYPNPFNPSTTIIYDIPDEDQSVDVKLWIYDLRGRLIRQLVDEENLPGRYAVQWDGRDDRGKRTSSGVYFYRITAGDFVSIRKLVLIK